MAAHSKLFTIDQGDIRERVIVAFLCSFIYQGLQKQQLLSLLLPFSWSRGSWVGAPTMGRQVTQLGVGWGQRVGWSVFARGTTMLTVKMVSNTCCQVHLSPQIYITETPHTLWNPQYTHFPRGPWQWFWLVNKARLTCFPEFAKLSWMH